MQLQEASDKDGFGPTWGAYSKGKIKRLRRMFMRLQGGRCGICAVVLTEETSPLHDNSAYVDHDHTTNRARGVLCRSCNGKLGRVKDDVTRFPEAAVYLSKPQHRYGDTGAYD